MRKIGAIYSRDVSRSRGKAGGEVLREVDNLISRKHESHPWTEFTKKDHGNSQDSSSLDQPEGSENEISTHRVEISFN